MIISFEKYYGNLAKEKIFTISVLGAGGIQILRILTSYTQSTQTVSPMLCTMPFLNKVFRLNPKALFYSISRTLMSI